MKKLVFVCILALTCNAFLPAKGHAETSANVTSLKEVFVLLETDNILLDQCDYNESTPEEICWANGIEGGTKTLAAISSGLSLNDQGVASTLSIGSHGATEVTWGWSEKKGKIFFDDKSEYKIYKNRYLVGNGDVYMFSDEDYAKILEKLKTRSQGKTQPQSSQVAPTSPKEQLEKTRAEIAKQMQLNDEVLQKALKGK